MGNYLRDKNLTKKTITEEALKSLVEILEEQERSLNQKNANGYCYLSFIIRYDRKGYRVFVVEDLLNHYKKAREIERIVLKLDVVSDMPSQMHNGEAIEIWLSNMNNENPNLKVEGNTLDWVNLTFAALDDVLDQCRSRFSWVKGSWIPLTVQLLGVVIVFFVSLLLSQYASEHLIFENPGLFTFIFFFLVLSNIWTYLNPLIMRALEIIFPNIYFSRKGKEDLNLVAQAAISAGFFGFVWYVLSTLSTKLTPFLLSFIK